jgi:hypothetical protein
LHPLLPLEWALISAVIPAQAEALYNSEAGQSIYACAGYMSIQ